MTTFTTKIQEIKILPQDFKSGLRNVVFLVGFSVEGVDGEFKHSVIRNIGIGPADPVKFTPIEELTTDQLLLFVSSSLAPDDMRCVQNEIEETISQQKKPKQELFVMKWVN